MQNGQLLSFATARNIKAQLPRTKVSPKAINLAEFAQLETRQRKAKPLITHVNGGRGVRFSPPFFCVFVCFSALYL